MPPGTQWTTGGPPNVPGGGWICDSREVVFRPAYQNEYPIGAGMKVGVLVPQGSWLWQTSGLYLYLAP